MHGFFLFDSVGETAWPLCFDHRGSSSLTFLRLTVGDCQASCMLLLARRFPGVLGWCWTHVLRPATQHTPTSAAAFEGPDTSCTTRAWPADEMRDGPQKSMLASFVWLGMLVKVYSSCACVCH
jgi:hypothetical protein